MIALSYDIATGIAAKDICRYLSIAVQLESFISLLIGVRFASSSTVFTLLFTLSVSLCKNSYKPSSLPYHCFELQPI